MRPRFVRAQDLDARRVQQDLADGAHPLEATRSP
jgi:hypothetical protein